MANVHVLDADDGARNPRFDADLDRTLGDVLGQIADPLEIAGDANRANDLASRGEVRPVRDRGSRRPATAESFRRSRFRPGELISKNRESVGRRRLPRNQRGLYSRLGCGKTNCSVFDAEAWRKEKKHYGRPAANLDRSRPARGEGVDPLPRAVRRSGLIAVVTLELMSGPRRGRERGRQWGNHDRSKSR
jgi:hypothetical protein